MTFCAFKIAPDLSQPKAPESVKFTKLQSRRLIALDSDHITHLIGPFRGDVRRKIANEMAQRTIPKKSAITDHMQEFVRRGLSRRCNDILDDQEICKVQNAQAMWREIAIADGSLRQKNDLAHSTLALIDDEPAQRNVSTSIKGIR